MIKRLYIDNFRCLTNFEFKIEREKNALFLGENGAGKSSLLKILFILQRIAGGDNSLADKFTEEDFGLGGIEHPIFVEIDVEISDILFSYGIVVEYPENFKKPRIKKEQLTANGEPCFSRSLADISVGKATFSLDWHIAALPIIQANEHNPVIVFRNWLKEVLLLKPIPSIMSGGTDDNNAGALFPSASNFVSWISAVLGQYPHFYGDIAQYLQSFFTDFSRFLFLDSEKNLRQLELVFEKDNTDFSVPFEKLSDGEKMLFLSAVVFAMAKNRKNVFCFWDEPNNYISASLLDNFIRKLLCCFEQHNGQLWVISHNIEIITGFNEENSWVFRRMGHTNATLPLKNIAERRRSKVFAGDLVVGLQTGDIYDAEQA